MELNIEWDFRCVYMRCPSRGDAGLLIVCFGFVGFFMFVSDLFVWFLRVWDGCYSREAVGLVCLSRYWVLEEGFGMFS